MRNGIFLKGDVFVCVCVCVCVCVVMVMDSSKRERKKWIGDVVKLCVCVRDWIVVWWCGGGDTQQKRKIVLCNIFLTPHSANFVDRENFI